MIKDIFLKKSYDILILVELDSAARIMVSDVDKPPPKKQQI